MTSYERCFFIPSQFARNQQTQKKPTLGTIDRSLAATSVRSIAWHTAEVLKGNDTE